jgi:hypothetical protein
VFKIKKKKELSLIDKEYLVYAVSDQTETPRFLIFGDDDERCVLWIQLEI